ncbi:MAG: 5'/3'-nucleotidase SurE, partial [Alphaproteobacteria bacterium]
SRILVTNDDGIYAPGLGVLENIARQLTDDVWVVAPEQEQSGAAHSLTLHLPVRLRKLEDKCFAVSGTPTDCVLMALKQVITDKPVDLVLSGVNRGSNLGDDIAYSGTVAAAMEGTNLGVPSIALSQAGEDAGVVYWETAQMHAAPVIRKLVEVGWPKNSLININFPECLPDDVKGVQVCPHGKRLVNVALAERMDLKKRPYFWLGGERDNTADREGVDLELVAKGFITVTPLNMDMTDYRTIERLQATGSF